MANDNSVAMMDHLYYKSPPDGVMRRVIPPGWPMGTPNKKGIRRKGVRKRLTHRKTHKPTQPVAQASEVKKNIDHQDKPQPDVIILEPKQSDLEESKMETSISKSVEIEERNNDKTQDQGCIDDIQNIPVNDSALQSTPDTCSVGDNAWDHSVQNLQLNFGGTSTTFLVLPQSNNSPPPLKYFALDCGSPVVPSLANVVNPGSSKILTACRLLKAPYTQIKSNITVANHKSEELRQQPSTHQTEQDPIFTVADMECVSGLLMLDDDPEQENPTCASKDKNMVVAVTTEKHLSNAPPLNSCNDALSLNSCKDVPSINVNRDATSAYSCKDVGLNAIDSCNDATPRNLCKHQAFDKHDVRDVMRHTGFPMEVRSHLEACMPPHWYVVNELNGIVLLRKSFTSGNNFIVQRSIFVRKDRTVEIFVHLKPLQPTHEIWGFLPPSNAVDVNSVCEFSEYALKVMNLVRTFEICNGCPKSEFFDIAKEMENTVYDSNIFHESRYSVTYRSVDCKMLICNQKIGLGTCEPCKKLKFAIRRRYDRKKALQNLKVSTAINLIDTLETHVDSTSLGESTSLMTGLEESSCFEEPRSLETQTANKVLNRPQILKNPTNGTVTKKSRKNQNRHASRVQTMLSRSHHELHEDLSDELAHILDKSQEEVIAEALGSTLLTHLQQIFIREQILASQVKKSCAVKWHPVIVRIALKIVMGNTQQYDSIRGILHLPSSRKLFDYSQYVGVEDGVSVAAVEDLREKMSKFEGDVHEKYHALLMDEIHVSKNLVYSRMSGELVGFVKLDEVGKEMSILELELKRPEVKKEKQRVQQPVAKPLSAKRKPLDLCGTVVPEVSHKILTFMVKGITTDVKQVVAAFSVQNLTAESIREKVWDVVRHLENAEILVLVLICDGQPMNRSFIKLHTPFLSVDKKLSLTKSRWPAATFNIVNMSRPMYIMIDTAYLLRAIRNAFYNSGECSEKGRDLKVNGQSIRWETMKTLYEDKAKSRLRVAYKLGNHRANLGQFSKMKLSYAAQVMNRTVANAITDMGQPHSEETARFIRKVNKFYDCINGCSSSDARHKRNYNLNPYNSVNDKRFAKLDKFVKYLYEWKAQTGKAQLECLHPELIAGVEVTVSSFQACIKFMIGKGAKTVMAGALCDNPLEQTFSKTRLSGM